MGRVLSSASGLAWPGVLLLLLALAATCWILTSNDRTARLVVLIRAVRQDSYTTAERGADVDRANSIQRSRLRR